MKLDEIAVVLAQGSSVFSNFTLTKEAIKTWHSLFESESFEDFTTAFRVCIKEPGRSFFPTPGEINKILLNMRMAHIPDADEAWNTLLRYAGGGDERGAYKYLEGNEAGQRALERVTFQSLRYADIETELPWLRKEFISSYQEISESIKDKGQIFIGREEAKLVLDRTFKMLGVKS